MTAFVGFEFAAVMFLRGERKEEKSDYLTVMKHGVLSMIGI